MSAAALDWILGVLGTLIAADIIAGLVRGRLLLFTADKRKTAPIFYFYLIVEVAAVALIALSVAAAAD